jgi:hypothetical protein
MNKMALEPVLLHAILFSSVNYDATNVAQSFIIRE